MTNRGRRSSEPNDEMIDLSDEEIERRLSGGAGLGSVTERAPKPAPKKRGRSGGGGLLFRDVGLVLVLLLFLGAGANFVLNPAHAENSPTPGSSDVALASPSGVPQPTTTAVPTAPPVGLPSDVIGSLAPEATPTPIPTPTPVPTPTLAPGQTPKPTPKPTTNTTATLRVYMDVVNDQGGLHHQADWTLSLSGTGLNPNPASFAGPATGYQVVTVHSGVPYVILASGVSGYAKSTSGDCAGPLAAGATGSCTVTENDRPASVLVKTVVETGSANPSDFSVVVTAANVSPTSAQGNAGGVLYSFDANATFTVDVQNLPGYVATPSGSCSGTGVGGFSKSCTMTLNATTAPITGSGPAPGPLAWAVWLPLVLPRRRRSPGR